MAITDRIKAEAVRTIAGIQRYYEKYGEDLEDAEEKEHRIARIEAAMEGCNGLSQEDKVQKTAENLFELTCAQERSFDSIHKEIKILREENNHEFDILRMELRQGIEGLKKTIESSGMDGSQGKSDKSSASGKNLIVKLVSEHPIVALNAFLFTLVLVFISGHFESLIKLVGASN